MIVKMTHELNKIIAELHDDTLMEICKEVAPRINIDTFLSFRRDVGSPMVTLVNSVGESASASRSRIA